jgi:hypothetical protein
MISSDYSYSDTRIQFCERDDNSGAVTRYTLSKTGTKRTKLFLDYYLKSNFISELFFKLTARQKFERTVKKSMENLDSLVKELKIPSAADC